jgi:uncharacterized delta-60 repeat protein
MEKKQKLVLMTRTRSKVFDSSLTALRILRVCCLTFLVLCFVGAPAANGQSPKGFAPDINRNVHAVVIQPDGKIVVGGQFTVVNGTRCEHIVRLNRDGGMDTTFNSGVDFLVDGMALQKDGGILVAGGALSRLLSDGTVDFAFNPAPNTSVRAVVIQPDQKILVGGFFTNIGGLDRSYIARLNPDGSADADFNPPVITGPTPSVQALALQADGKILFGGFFTNVGGKIDEGLVRLQPDGKIDADFSPPVLGSIESILIQTDGKILAGGDFVVVDWPLERLVRLNPDGTVDKGFKGRANVNVESMALQSDGKILLGGWFNELDNQPCKYFGRLNPDGSRDTNFVSSAESLIYSLAVQGDGKILVGGQLTNLCGQACKYLGRLNPDGTPDFGRQPTAAAP